MKAFPAEMRRRDILATDAEVRLLTDAQEWADGKVAGPALRIGLIAWEPAGRAPRLWREFRKVR